MENLGELISYGTALVGLISSGYLLRKNKKLEVHSKEIATADQMIDLVKKANAEALTLNKKENDKLRKSISNLERALRSITTCAHRADCPVTFELQNAAIATQQSEPTNGQRDYSSNCSGYDDYSEVGQFDDTSVTRMRQPGQGAPKRANRVSSGR